MMLDKGFTTLNEKVWTIIVIKPVPADELEGGSWLVEGRSDSSDAWTDSSSCWLSISRPASEVMLEGKVEEENPVSIFA